MTRKGFCELPLIKIKECAWNYKLDDKELESKLKANIEKNGQIENLIVRSIKDGLYECVNGNHRLKVLRDLGVDKVRVFNLGTISQAKAKRIAVETNETKFRSDPLKLCDVVREVHDEFGMVDISETLPYTGDEIETLISLDDPPKEEEKDEPKYTNQETKTKFIVDGSLGVLMRGQVDRIKHFIYPDRAPENVPDSAAFDFMCGYFSTMSDNELKAEVYSSLE